MHKSDAQSILRNLDKIEHYANGGSFTYQSPTGLLIKQVTKLNLPNLDYYNIVVNKPVYKLHTSGYITFVGRSIKR